MGHAIQSTVPHQDAGHAAINLGRLRRVPGERMGPEFVRQRLELLGVTRGDDQPRPRATSWRHKAEPMPPVAPSTR